MSDINRKFVVKSGDHEVVMVCTEHTKERRVLEVAGTWFEFDFVEWYRLVQEGIIFPVNE